MAMGLDRAGRDVVRVLLEKKAPPADIRDAIKRLAKADKQLWSFERNKSLIEELTSRGYPKTARYLAECIENERRP